MKPVLLQLTLGGREYTLLAYSTFYTLAWVIAPTLAAWLAHKRGVSWRQALTLYATALASGIVGARVLDLFIAGDFYAEDPSRIWSANFQGFSLYGGLMVATLVGVALARAWKMPVWRLADSAVPALVVGQILMRTGCFLRGCCSGLPTDLPWGVTYPAGSPAWAQQLLGGSTGILGMAGHVDPVHPTQLYEMAGAILFGLVALWLARRGFAEGVPFLAYALGFTFVRLGNGFLRVRQDVITAPEWFYPAFYLGLAAVLAAMIGWRSRQSKAEPPRYPEPDGLAGPE